MLRWVFFDMGDALLFDHRQSLGAYVRLWEAIRGRRPDYGFDRLMAERERRINAGETFVSAAIAEEILGLDGKAAFHDSLWPWLRERYADSHVPYPDATACLDRLGDLRLGIIANQPRCARDYLEAIGWLERFEVIAISDEIDLHKPDPELYRWAIDRAGCRAEEAAMVGDRLDNDVEPAQRIGMRGVWVDRAHSASTWDAFGDPTSWSCPRACVEAFYGSCARTPLFASSSNGTIRPDAHVASLSEAADRLLCWI